MNADFDILKHEEEYIFIRDIGHNRGRSVTNDAEYVIKKLYSCYGITDDTRVIYEDSSGDIDEILHLGENFIGFKSGHGGIEI